jgi:cation diffusion facilitator family transporter
MPANRTVRRLAAASIAVAFIVMAIKFLAWYLTGSVALFSDALESIVNVIAAVIAWYAIRLSHKPADDEHPFGHHKAEYFSAVAEGVLIVLAALIIMHEAWLALQTPHIMDAPLLGLGVNAAASVINAVWAYILISTGRKARSPALVADGMHIYTDVITSVGVLAGLLIAIETGWAVLDPIMAIVVAINILWQGWRVISGSVQGLMDGALEAHDQETIRSTIAANATGAIEFHDLKTREAGAVRFAEFHLVVPSNMSVSDAHDICDRIENELKQNMKGISVLIHVEPENKAKHGGYAV